MQPQARAHDARRARLRLCVRRDLRHRRRAERRARRLTATPPAHAARERSRAALPAVGRSGLGRRQPVARWPASTASTAAPATSAGSSSRWRCCARRPAGPQLALQRLPVQAAQHPGDDDRADGAPAGHHRGQRLPLAAGHAEHRGRLQRLLALGRRDRAGRLRQLRAARGLRRARQARRRRPRQDRARPLRAELPRRQDAPRRGARRRRGDHLLRSRRTTASSRARSTPTGPSARPTASSAARSSTSGSTRAIR